MKKRGKRPNIQDEIQQQQKLNILEQVDPTRVFNLLDKDEISRYFQGFAHEAGLEQIDPQMLQLVYDKIIEHPPSIDSSEPQKTDVLNQGRKELLTFCKNKHLVSLFQYILTIKNNTHRHHSYYGLLLVHGFPEEFFVGPRCTHYHCKTTARKIQEEYGIYRPKSGDQKYIENDYIQESDEDFIDDDGEGEQSQSGPKDNEEEEEDEGQQQQQGQSSEHTMKRRSKVQTLQQKMNKKIEEKTNKFGIRKNKMSAFSDSESQNQDNKQAQESEQITTKRSKARYKAFSHKNMKKSQEAQILKIVEQNSVETILQNFSYEQIFLYLLECCEDKLLNILDADDVLTTIDANKRKAKRQKRKAKKLTGRSLQKSKINIKNLRLEELLEKCQQEQIIERDTLNWDSINPTQQHVIYGYMLIAKNPKRYSMEGAFKAYEQNDLDDLIEASYLNYQPAQSQMWDQNQA